MTAATTAATDASAPAKAASAPVEGEFDIPPFEATPATERDLECIEERQLLHQVGGHGILVSSWWTVDGPVLARNTVSNSTPGQPQPTTRFDPVAFQVTCAGGPRQPCKHGFPQAFVFHPSKTTFNSGLFRLTCPLLVKAVDEYEAQGA